MRFHLLPLLVLVSLTAFSAEPPVWDGTAQSSLKSRVRPTVGTKGMVVSDDRVASEWGAEILRQGGNAVDAAVATAFALSVTRPHFASIGGGGFLVYCPKPGSDGAKPCEALDYREIAPEKASRDMYIKDGKPRTDLSQDGALASGVPGVTAGLLQALEKWGTLSRDKLLARPIELARGGVAFTGLMEGVAQERWKAMNAEARRIFSCGSSAESPEAPCAAGTTLKQPDLAKTLQAISEKGVKGFYEGGVAQAIVDSLQAEGGILTLKDLKTYKPVLRKPVEGDAFGMHFVSMPPPSSGGAIVLQLLAYASRADKQGLLNEGYGSPKTLHALAHGMALAFADRAKFFGDPDRVEVPLVKLLSPEYLDARWKTFQPDKAAIPEGAGELVIPGTSPSPSPNSSGVPDSHTTHFSVIDKDGNAVAVTTTINDDFGSGFVPMGTGVVMNNEMDDFSVQPGVPNLFGLVGGEANAIAPGKKPLSSMSPTIVRDAAGNNHLVIGAAGGPQIITSVFETLLNRYRFGMSVSDALAAGRAHEQWKPTALRLDRNAFAPETSAKLKAMGYTVEEIAHNAVGHALERFPNGRVWGAPDDRGSGAAAAE